MVWRAPELGFRWDLYSSETKSRCDKKGSRTIVGRRSGRRVWGHGMAGVENKALLARIAWMYYNQGMTQQAIGDQLGLSRNKVLRLLARARAEGIVQIRVVHPSI